MNKKHRVLSWLLLLTVCISFCIALSGNAAAAEYENATLILSEFFAAPGDQITTTVCIDKNANIMDFQLRLKYNTDVVTLVSAEENEDAGGSVVVNTETAGVIGLNYSRTKNTTKEMPVLDLTFAVDENIGVGNYELITVDATAKKKADRLVDNKITEVQLDTDFQKLHIYEMGDVDLSGDVDVTDATTLRRYLVELGELSEFQLSLADTCYDKKVDITDALYIQRKIALLKVPYGNRLNVYFYDAEGNQYAVKSVVFGGDLTRLPTVPAKSGASGGVWSASKDEYIEPVLTNIQESLKLYAFYTGQGDDSEDMQYYKQRLTEAVYSGDLPTGLSGNLTLPTRLNYQNGCYAEVVWASSNNDVLNSTTGKFTKPDYATKLTLTAQIVAYSADGTIKDKGNAEFVYQIKGKLATPSKDALANWLKDFFTYEDIYQVNYDLKLPQKITNEEVPIEDSVSTAYEVRVKWSCRNKNGVEESISEIKRNSTSQVLDLIATLTFNGEPLEDDGKVYLDDVHVTAIEEYEIRKYIIDQIAANMGQTLSEGTELWNNDTVYGSNVTWISSNVDMANINNNKISISSATVNGALLPLAAEVSYMTDGTAKTFRLEYTVSVSTSNTLLEPGTNISAELYDALKSILSDELGFSGNLTTGVLRDIRFVNLDLHEYPNITSLKGLSYCTNIHALNISGLHIEEGMSEISTLNKLEALVARGCGLSSLNDGGKAVLANSINLKLLDLSENSFTNLSSVLAENTRYGKLREVYLSDNQLTDISALSRAPIMMYLSLANNGLQTSDIAQIANFPYLSYLSLANNEITDISALGNLTNLKELRLQGNQLTDVRNLKKMSKMEVLYLQHNNINSGVEFLNNLTELKVLYLNDNRIDSINALTSLKNLQAINVSDNPQINNLTVLSSYAGTLEEVYAENDSLTSFSFIDGMTNLRILMLSGNAPAEADYSDLLSSQLGALTQMQVLTLSDKPLRDLTFLANMPELVRLDVANCKLTSGSDIDAITARYKTLRVLDISNNDMSGAETDIVKLKNMPNLVVLYADNLCKAFDASAITKEMGNLKYISLENCGITNLNWLAKYRDLAYVDLADNPFRDIDLGVQISTQSNKTLQYLYLDAAESSTFANAYASFDPCALEVLSLENVQIESLSCLPYMDCLTALNIANSGLTTLYGTEDPDLYDVYSIVRYKNLQTLNIEGVQADIAPLNELQSLSKLYALAKPDELMFYKDNIRMLQTLYNKGVTCYLYGAEEPYTPVAQTEGAKILGLLDDYSCDLTIAADSIISDNNPDLPTEINSFDITWTISNSVNYEIQGNHIAVRDYENIEDETLTLTAHITVYPDQTPAERSYTVNTKILRVNADTRSLYYSADTTGFGAEMQRGNTFTYDLLLHEGVTDGFTDPVKPVETETRYSYSSVLEDGSAARYDNVISETGLHSYLLLESAPLNSVTTITIETGHTVRGEFIVDDTAEASFRVAERTYTVTYVTNGGTVVDATGISITEQSKAEESILFSDITVSRSGYLFDGWFRDEACSNLYWTEGNQYPTMPSNDLTVYAKWTAHSYTITFDANGGTVGSNTMTVLCDEPIGELPVAQRDYYTFNGWFTAADGGEVVKPETVRTDAQNITLYAHWTLNPVSGWVLKSNMPTDAQIVNQKWSYNERSNLESTSTNMDGYTQYGSYWVQSASGSANYATFPKGYDTGNSYYTSFMKSPYSAYENTTNKRVVSNSWAGYIYWHWMHDCGGANAYYRTIYDHKGTASYNNYYYKYFGAFTSTSGYTAAGGTSYSCGSYGYPTYWKTGRTSNAESQGSYYWYRFDYYTSYYTDYYKVFQYYRIDAKESSTPVTESSTISNVQNWVQYRAR